MFVVVAVRAVWGRVNFAHGGKFCVSQSVPNHPHWNGRYCEFWSSGAVATKNRPEYSGEVPFRMDCTVDVSSNNKQQIVFRSLVKSRFRELTPFPLKLGASACDAAMKLPKSLINSPRGYVQQDAAGLVR